MVDGGSLEGSEGFTVIEMTVTDASGKSGADVAGQSAMVDNDPYCFYAVETANTPG